MAYRTTPMESGERDRMVTIQQLASTDQPGFPTEGWTTLITMAASKFDLRGSERMVAEQLAARYETRWEINYRADMDPEQVDVPATRRIVYQGRYHDIVGADMIGRKEGVELRTIAGTRVE